MINSMSLGEATLESRPRVFFVEDEPDIAELIHFTLLKAGFEVRHFLEGRDLIHTLSSKNIPDLLVLDLMLPDVGGKEICRFTRQELGLKDLPIVMLTARGEEADVVEGFDVGADDYIKKPFSPRVLEARINALLRRTIGVEQKDQKDKLTVGALQIVKGKREVSISGASVKLTKSEFDILFLLASHPGWVYSRSQIVDVIRGDNYSVTDRTVDFQMVGLRKKLGSIGKNVETVRGVGYRFNA